MERLNEIHGDYWEIWAVSKLPAAVGFWWCARPRGTKVSTIREDTSGELEAAILAADAARCPN